MHYDILTSDLIQRAAKLARSLGHSYVGSAHLLLVMAREPGAAGQTLRLLGMDPDLTEAMARLPKPVFNIIKRVTSLFVASLTSARFKLQFFPLSDYAGGNVREPEENAAAFATAEAENLRWQGGKTATHMSC